MSCDWTDLLVAYLHDPPDKALAISGHEDRACRYAGAAGQQVQPDQLQATVDQLGSSIERLPMPSCGALRVDPRNGCLEIAHPLSGEHYKLEVGPVEEAAVAGVIEEIVAGLDLPKQRFLALWRLLPERMAERERYYTTLPADTRVPDHTIWHHLEVAAGLRAALSGPKGAAFLSFALGPVQPFIEAARSVRDLWSGSMILSWLTFQGMLPVVEEYGPPAIIFPSLRGMPLVDRWLSKQHLDKVPTPSPELLRSPCLPNRFLAVVPWESDGKNADCLAKECQEAVRSAWRRLANKMREKIHEALREKEQEFPDWAELWDQQIDGFFSITTAVLPLADCGDEEVASLFGVASLDEAFPEAAKVRRLAEAILDQDGTCKDRTSIGRWQAQSEISARLMEARRAVRHIPPSTKQTPVPGKCSLLGTFEQMGPAGLEESRRFWEAMAERVRVGLDRIRKRERFCAVTLTKRFAPQFLAKELGIGEHQLRTPDTATVAATNWLKRACGRGYDLDPDQIRSRRKPWNGQWLFWAKQDQGKDEGEELVPDDVWKTIQKARKDKELGPLPTYYVILMMDGDHMGRWLSGEMSPRVEKALHPDALSYFRNLEDARVEPALKARRPLGPAYHAAISEALTNFALYVARQIVAEHHGTLIYAGGDDVLAMLPASEVVACASQLRLAFSGDPQVNGGARAGYYKLNERELLMMGPTATASCGLAVVHYKEDLRFALREARRAEKAAKDAGRDALQIAVCRRSGEHSSVLCPWGFAPTVERWVQAFVEGASDRWAYRLYAQRETITALPHEAFCALLLREVEHAEESTRQKLAAPKEKSAGKVLVEAFNEYLSQLRQRPRNLSEQEVVADFVLLCQTASFLARGRTQ